MTDIQRFRSGRFHRLYALLTGEGRSERIERRAVPNHLLRDLGLPEGTRQEQHISHLGICTYRS